MKEEIKESLVTLARIADRRRSKSLIIVNTYSRRIAIIIITHVKHAKCVLPCRFASCVTAVDYFSRYASTIIVRYVIDALARPRFSGEISFKVLSPRWRFPRCPGLGIARCGGLFAISLNEDSAATERTQSLRYRERLNKTGMCSLSCPFSFLVSIYSTDSPVHPGWYAINMRLYFLVIV